MLFAAAKIGEFVVTDVFENQCLAAIANHDPFVRQDVQLLHRSTPVARVQPHARRANSPS